MIDAPTNDGSTPVPKHPDCPPRSHPSWQRRVVARLDEVEGAWTDPATAYAVIDAFTGGSGAASVVAELIKQGRINPQHMEPDP